MTDIEASWETRSKQYGRRIEGVLPKSLPPELNNYLDNFMFEEIAGCVGDKSQKMLDLGCGYGRLSKRLLQKYSNLKITGVDLSQTYVDIYNRQLNPRGVAIKGDIKKLPFKNNTFDIVFIVTALMYVVDRADQERVISEMVRVLKHKGFLIIIERSPIGHAIFTLGGFLPAVRGKNKNEISSVSFKYGEMKKLLKKNNLEVLKVSGVPFWTMFIHLNLALSFISKALLNTSLKFTHFLDKKFSSFLTPSMYISYISTRKK